MIHYARAALEPTGVEDMNSGFERCFPALISEPCGNTILNAERPELAIIRTLDGTSAELWSGRVTGVSPKDTWVAGLLLLALWRPDLPGPADEIPMLFPGK